MLGMFRKGLIAAALMGLAACQSVGTAPPPQAAAEPGLDGSLPRYPFPKGGKGAAATPEPAPRAYPMPPPASGASALPPPLYPPSGNGGLSGMSGMQGMSGMFGSVSEPSLPPAPAGPGGPTRAALLLPLSGANAGLGKSLLNAAQMAVFAFADKNFELMPLDTQGTAEGAADAARRAISGNAAVILGPLLAAEMKAVAPIAKVSDIPVIGFSTDRSAASDGVFTIGFLPRAEIRRVTEHAVAEGITQFASLAPDNAYGHAVTEAYRSAIQAGGGTLVKARFYSPDTSDFSAVIKDLGDFDRRHAAMLAEKAKLAGKTDEASVKARERMKKQQTIGDAPFQALLVVEGGKKLQTLAAMLPYYDIDPGTVRMLGTGQWDIPGLGAEPALLGAWYAAPPPNERAAFEQEYQGTYGAKPPRLVTLAYDAVALAAVLGRTSGGGRFSRAAIADPGGFAGRDGIFRFLPDGTNERGLAVLQIERTGAKVIAPAPTTFEKPAN